MTNHSLDVVWVDEQEHFSQLSESWQSCQFLAIDTEFERRTTYYPLLALVQVFDGDKIYLIDPLKVKADTCFQSICSNPTIIKIMHSAREDLEVLLHAWNCEIKGLFDTQLAYAFLSDNLSIGYANLVSDKLNIQLAKQATLSDWMKRPLSNKQLNYAAEDVVFLPQLYQDLKSNIESSNNNDFFLHECYELCDAVRHLQGEDDYRHASDAWLLKPEQLPLFKQLYDWRQARAESENRCLNHIFKDHQLVKIVTIMPQKLSDFNKLADLHPRSKRIYGPLIIDLIKSFHQEECKNLKAILNPRDMSDLKKLTDKLAASVKQRSKVLGVNNVLLMSKRQIKRIAYAYLANEAYPDSYKGWRGEILKPVFEPIFDTFNIQQAD
jgi:ribonuclease D